ncbi:hypothetical protein BDF14DRAFT_1795980 [Spinellus fusiger]|nr:hypothetical protein BDF14DRAFT_1795980 [Spinellus fusiger]
MFQQKMTSEPPDQVIQLTSQNKQLWKIIEKQRIMIQTLQKDNARLASERDGLYDKIDSLEYAMGRKHRGASILISPQAMREMAEAEDNHVSEDGPVSPTDTVSSLFSREPLISPMPPPRSPYRSFKDTGKDTSKDTSKSTEQVQVAHKEQLQHQRPKQLNFSLASLSSSSLHRLGDMEIQHNSTSAPNSPAPGPHTPTSPHTATTPDQDMGYPSLASLGMARTASASSYSSPPYPSSPSNEHSLFVPTSSKSTSILEGRRSARMRDSMMPPPRVALEHDPTLRAASPPLLYFGQLPYANDSFLSLHVPDANRKRESAILFNTPIDMNAGYGTEYGIGYGTGYSTGYSTGYGTSIAETGIAETEQEEWTCLSKETSEGTSQVPYINEPSVHSTHSVNESQEEGIRSLGVGGITNVFVKVVGSNIKKNDKGKEVISFIISVGKKPTPEEEEEYKKENTRMKNGFKELWRVEKLYSDFLNLDAKLKTRHDATVASKIGKLPDKALFATNAPSKVDLRKHALEVYLQHLVSLAMVDATDLCEFLSTNVIERKTFCISDHKEGYLTKRGKNFGGWKTRYFVLNGPTLDYFESKDGNHLGTVRLTNAQIAQQTPGITVLDEFSAYRHAFLILEKRRPGSSQVNRHILCAASDEERDEWVEAVFQNIVLDDTETKKKKDKPLKMPKPTTTTTATTTVLQGKSEPAIPNEKPCHAMSTERTEPMAIQIGAGTPPPSNSETSLLSTSLPNTTSPLGWPGADSHSQPPTLRTSFDQPGRTLQPQPVANRRSSMISLLDSQQDSPPYSNPSYANPPSTPHPSHHPTVDQSVMANPRETHEEPQENLLELPDKKIKNKANRMTFWDPSTLPTHPRPSTSSDPTGRSSALPNPSSFHLLDRKDRVNELGRLVSLVPLANYTLLRALTAHLIRVVQNAHINKMTMRNVSIVFAPTLGIPATIFNLLMSEFEYIFWTTEDGDAAPRMLQDDQSDSEGSPLPPPPLPEHQTEVASEQTPTSSTKPALSRRPTLKLREEHGRSNRNSVNYMDGAPNAIVDLELSMEGRVFLGL